MSWQATSWAKSTRGHRSRGDKLVLMVLADYAGPTWKCWPSIKTLAQDCEMTERAVIMSLNELERRGFIERVRRGNQHLPSSYLLNRTSQTSLPGNRSPKALAAEDEQVKFPPSASEINNGANEAHFTVGTTEKDRSEESIEQVEQQLTSFFPNPEVDKLFHRALKRAVTDTPECSVLTNASGIYMDQRRFLIGCPAGINIAFAERRCYAAVQRALSKELNGQIPDLQFVQL